MGSILYKTFKEAVEVARKHGHIVVRNGDGWDVKVTNSAAKVIAPPPFKETVKKKIPKVMSAAARMKRFKDRNAAADKKIPKNFDKRTLYITGDVKTSVVSGGLPSLGKKRR
jgi:hypothetical protein